VRFLAVAQVLTEVQSGFFDRKKAAAPKSRGAEKKTFHYQRRYPKAAAEYLKGYAIERSGL
jgi:hypothetical protein